MWQISAGYLSELLLPAAFALSIILSTLVLADARRRFSTAAAFAWTLFALALPHVTLPLYLVARAVSPRTATRSANREQAAPPAAAGPAESPAMTGGAGPPPVGRRPAPRLALPLAYAAALLALAALYFYFDHRSADAHFARAASAKLLNRTDAVVREYRAALAVADDAHTRKLLGLELSGAGRWEEALAELRAAERGGDPDDALAFHLAAALAALDRPAEAADEYRRFTQSGACAQTPPDRRCEDARAHLSGL